MTAAAPCGCPRAEGIIRHQSRTCTDTVVARLGWYADQPAASHAAAEPTRTGQMRTYTCRDCGSVGSEPTHHPDCHRFHVARLWSSRAAVQAREAMTAWRTANDAFTGTSLAPSAAAEWTTARDAEIAARNALIPALAGLLVQLDTDAGIVP